MSLAASGRGRGAAVAKPGKGKGGGRTAHNAKRSAQLVREKNSLVSALAEIAKAPTLASDSTSILKPDSQPVALNVVPPGASVRVHRSQNTALVIRMSLHQPPLPD